ncbi:MAG TPA: tetratricopeptide repeat protein [Candidatus Sulfotelmatobacter sp.]|nr:tetratricopeptide repeat protein [Candidatus Sulfotelmatobacter sp.]
MTDIVAAQKLAVAWRRSGILVLIGTIVALSALAFSARQAAMEAERARESARVAQMEAERVSALQAESKQLSATVSSLREALSSSRIAIQAFKRGDYANAVKFYDEALEADPNNAYLLNLRAYAMFKMHKYDDALQAQLLTVRADPNYAWGYFDLARFQCATGKRDEARESIAKALSLRQDLTEIMRGDGEFRRVCGNIVP